MWSNGGMIFAGETEVLGANLPSATLPTTNPTWIDPGMNPGLRGERPATNRLSHGTAFIELITECKFVFLHCVRLFLEKPVHHPINILTSV
jgi:hypothetical protein